jgi:cobalt-zinc-cadmium efflux system protein
MDRVHDLHVWSLTSGLNAMSAHAVLTEGASFEHVLRAVQARVTTEFEISHATIQVEPPGHQERETHL